MCMGNHGLVHMFLYFVQGMPYDSSLMTDHQYDRIMNWNFKYNMEGHMKMLQSRYEYSNQSEAKC
jgi:hypothetical protein